MMDPTLPPPPTLEEERKLYHEFLASAFNNALAKATAEAFTDFPVNADRNALANVQGLILTTGEGETIHFRDANDRFHDVTVGDLKHIAKKIAERQQALYESKWQLGQTIDQADSIEVLHGLNIVVD